MSGGDRSQFRLRRCGTPARTASGSGARITSCVAVPLDRLDRARGDAAEADLVGAGEDPESVVHGEADVIGRPSERLADVHDEPRSDADEQRRRPGDRKQVASGAARLLGQPSAGDARAPAGTRVGGAARRSLPCAPGAVLAQLRQIRQVVLYRRVEVVAFQDRRRVGADQARGAREVDGAGADARREADEAAVLVELAAGAAAEPAAVPPIITVVE